MKKKLHLTLGMTLFSLIAGIQVNAQWGLSGNGGTTNANFLGTTDYKTLKIKTNNTERMSINADGYVSIGTAPAFGSIGAGAFSISASIGSWAGMYTNGTSSSIRPFYGYASQGSAMAYHYYDVSTGSWRLNMLSGDRLTVTQFGLVGIGTSSPSEMLQVVGNGTFSGSVSSNSMVTNSIDVNTITGPVSMNGNVTINGGDFTLNGFADFNNSGTFNCNKLASGTSDSQAAIFGTAALSPGSPNLFSIGVAGSDNSRPAAYGLWSSGKTHVAGDIEYTGDIYEISDAQFKTNIVEMKSSLDLIKQLKPIEYEFKKDSRFSRFRLSDRKDHGFIAQDLEKIFPSLVIEKTQPLDLFAPEGEMITYKMVNYVGLIPFLTKGIQEQQMMIEQQSSEIDQLKSQINELNEKMLRLENLVDHQLNNGTTNVNRSSQLFVNNPNPFDKQTTIRYFISQNVITASILLMDMNGKVINTFELTQKGEGSITVQGDQLTSGMYSYILMIDGNVADSKKMIVNK
jgi:hypothetical protein